MANIRDLKKDINFLMEEVIETCFLHYHLKGNDKKEKEKIDQIIDEIILKRNELIQKVNNPDLKEGKQPGKKYYTDIISDMVKKAEESFEKLNVSEK